MLFINLVYIQGIPLYRLCYEIVIISQEIDQVQYLPCFSYSTRYHSAFINRFCITFKLVNSSKETNYQASRLNNYTSCNCLGCTKHGLNHLRRFCFLPGACNTVCQCPFLQCGLGDLLLPISIGSLSFLFRYTIRLV